MYEYMGTLKCAYVLYVFMYVRVCVFYVGICVFMCVEGNKSHVESQMLTYS